MYARGTRRSRLAALLIASLSALTPHFLPGADPGIYEPSGVVSIFVEGFDTEGASQTGVFGLDEQDDLVDAIAPLLGVPTGLSDPGAPNQIAFAPFYGDVPPPYYTAQDLAELNQTTAQWGGGVPRYALIMAKYTKHVLERSGARQANLVGGSFGGLITRWMIEKDIGGLVSSGRLARWMTIEGVVAGNYAATLGEDLGILDRFGLNTTDVAHMNYNWVNGNLHNDRRDADNPLLSRVRIHHWRSTDDNLNDGILSRLSSKPNDGVQLFEDAALRNLTAPSRNLGLIPMVSNIHATHESAKQNLGIRAGLAAQLTGRRRVTAKLARVRVLDDHESLFQGDAEAVFGIQVRSPLALTLFGIGDPVNELIRESHTPPLYTMKQNQWKTTNMILFDDMILSGEASLTLSFTPVEIDDDDFYGVVGLSGAADAAFEPKTIQVSTLQAGVYPVTATDWEGEVGVSLFDYPPFLTSNAAKGWTQYR